MRSIYGFKKYLAALPLAAAMLLGRCATGASPVEYIRPEIPTVALPKYDGEQRVERVPDTLDLQAMAALSINCLTGITDPDYDYEIYWAADFFRNPPVMFHDFSDWCQIKFMEELPLMRIMSGSRQNMQVDQAWNDVALKSLGPDGLFYIPLKGRPWSRVNLEIPRFTSPVWRSDGTTTTVNDESVSQFTNPYVIGRSLSMVTVFYLASGNDAWKKAGERIVDRLQALAIDKGDYCYFPAGIYEPNAKFPVERVWMPVEFFETGSRTLHGLAQFYRATGYEPARRLGDKLVHYIRNHGNYFDREGRFLLSRLYYRDANLPKELVYGGHFHNHSLSLLSMTEFALATDDRELLDFARRGFEWAITQGNARTGFFPEMILPGHKVSETCAIADMLALAVKLSEGGAGDYWDEIDRWLRNHFAESQLRRGDWIYRLAATQPAKPVAANETADRLAERTVGSFAGWSTPNDWVHHFGIQQCCIGNAPRSIYYIWEQMLEYSPEKLKLNLLVNRPSPWADVDSHIPYTGLVEIRIKQPADVLSARAPQWIRTGDASVRGTVNGREQKLAWNGRYLELAKVKPGDVVRISFPIGEETVRETIAGDEYTLVLKGSTVVFIDPPGKHGPLYQREHLREDRTRWVDAERFIPTRFVKY